jgi:hypothetical protein
MSPTALTLVKELQVFHKVLREKNLQFECKCHATTVEKKLHPLNIQQSPQPVLQRVQTIVGKNSLITLHHTTDRMSNQTCRLLPTIKFSLLMTLQTPISCTPLPELISLVLMKIDEVVGKKSLYEHFNTEVPF